MAIPRAVAEDFLEAEKAEPPEQVVQYYKTLDLEQQAANT